MLLASIIGYFGTLVYLISFWAVNSGRVRGEGVTYSLMNLVGSSCVAASLWMGWLGPAFSGEVIWMVISTVGLISAFWKKRKVDDYAK